MGGIAGSAAPLHAAARMLAGAALALAVWGAQAVTLSPATLPQATAGFAYQQTFTAADGQAPYAFSIESGMLPPGLTLTPDGQLSGTPSGTAPFSFSLYGTDFNGREGILNTTLAAAAPLALANASLVYQIGQSVNTNVAAANGNPPYACSTVSAMPPGMSLSAACVLSGQASSLGSSVLAIHMVDANGVQGNVNLSILVTPVLVLATPTLTRTTAYPFSFALAAANGVAPYSCSPLSALPAGVTLSPTCMLSGAQTIAGSYVIRFHITDNVGASGDVELALLLTDPLVIPVNSGWMLALAALLLAASVPLLRRHR